MPRCAKVSHVLHRTIEQYFVIREPCFSHISCCLSGRGLYICLQGYFDASTTEELEQAISSLKAMVSKAVPHTDTFRELIRKLVQMRLRLLEAKVTFGNLMISHSNNIFNTILLDANSYRSSMDFCASLILKQR